MTCKIRNEEFNNKSTMIKTLRTLYILMAFALLPAFAAAQGTRYYVALKAAGTGDGSSWGNATTLGDALAKAKANDEIWVMGYNDEGNSKFYFVPKAGYTLKSGVKLYGGFNGTETSSIDEREVIDNKAYRMVYRTVISGDIDKNDTLDAANLIFPGNGTRTDNAIHVLTLNMTPDQTNVNNWATVVDGVTIAGGHAEAGKGGGIYITGDNDNGNNNGGRYILRRCFFIGNYAAEGGALYVESTVKNVGGTCLIDRCGFFNNAAGTRGTVANDGGAVCLAGAGTIVNTAIFNNENGGVKLTGDNATVINSTVTRNTGSGIDGLGKTVANTVVWGNSRLSTDGQEPAFNHCSYPEANADGQPDSDGNIYLDTRNNEEQGPHFDSPSLKTGFDTDYDVLLQLYPLWTWVPLEGSNLIDKGDNGRYNNNGTTSSYGDTDLDGNTRINNGTIDIGAFEFQPVSASRIRYVTQDGTGDGTSWDNASGDLQAMIDRLAESGNGQRGEVWVAAGEYEPLAQLMPGTGYSASFRMRDGISVYGGFVGGETSKTVRDERRKKVNNAMPWQFFNDDGQPIETILSAAYYGEDNLEFNNNKWTTTSDSRHVVWFAPLNGDEAFARPTYLDGVTIRGGYAQGGTGLDEFKTDRGAGVYMDGRNTYLTGCTVKECYATGNGGGVYLKGGRVQTSLIYNNNADQGGGAVYVDDQGLVHRSMLANNSARNGAGVYLDNADGDNPEYLILSTCVVSNNTSTGNAAVYCNLGGVLLQNTVVNNRCVTATDLTDPNASQTGGLYLNEYGLVANSVIWNNRMGSSDVNIPMYAKNPTASKVRFMYNAISGINNAVWNNTLQEQTLALVDANQGEADNPNSIGPRFEEPTGDNFTATGNGYIDNAYGVQEEWSSIDYYWQPIEGSNLWARGLSLGQLPSEVLLAPEIDIAGGLFAQKPAVGAFHIDKANIVPALENGNTLVVYIDADCTEPDHYGSSWATAYRSLNDAISYFAGLQIGVQVDVAGSSGSSHTISDDTQFEIRVLEGDLWPRYAFVNEDPKTATLDILAMKNDKQLKIVGGYYRNNGSSDDVRRDPLNHRSQLNGNPDGDRLEDGLYHVVTVETGAQVELDGFHVINGYAAGSAALHSGGGMLVHDGATVTLINCIFENNTAADGAAIYAPGAASLTMRNCVVNNNTNTLESNKIIAANNLILQHVTVVNNEGEAPDASDLGNSSFAAGNTSGNSLTIETTGEAGAKNFANPTNGRRATLGFDTYLGGYASFRPLTSSAAAANHIINKGADSNLLTDIMGNDRNLGGVPDLGAYEADLPKAGEILYVRKDGSDNNNGLSWGTAFSTLEKALSVAENSSQAVKEIWVAEGKYTHLSENNDRLHDQRYAYYFVEGVNVYGGFSNIGAPNKDDRNPKTYVTILQAGNEEPETMANNNNRSYGRVLVQDRAFNVETVYDGFTLQHGYLFSCYRQNISGNLLSVKTELIGVTGGAGAYLLKNGVLENCVIQNNLVYVKPLHNNMDQTYEGQGGGYHQAGAGIYNSGGTIRNCVITDNKLWHSLSPNPNNKDIIESAWMYGAGLYMDDGLVFNTVISNNRAEITNRDDVEGYHEIVVGAGAFLVKGKFYNNTIIGNVASTGKSNYNYADAKNITLSGVYVYKDMTMYNCIVSGNTDDNGEASQNRNGSIFGYPIAALTYNGSSYSATADGVKVYYSCININENDSKNLADTNDRDHTNKYADPLVDEGYRLMQNSPAINSGTEEITGVTIPDYDADYTNRIKDCGIDMGAFESENEGNLKYTLDGNVGTYYVTASGFGDRSGQSPDNAACASKLQSILKNAGEMVANQTLAAAIVKVAGYETGNDGSVFKYSPTTLASGTDPLSYTFVVPDGVTVMGGYYEGDFSGGTYKEGSGWDDAQGENARNGMTFRTVLSAIAVPSSGSTITQEVNGYHAVTFGSWPGTAALTKGAVIDGVWLVDGSAASMAGAGNPATMGGGAIVPGGAHVRNCVVMGNQAVQGGGLYVMPGGTVSGTAVLGNTAGDDGGGIYAANKDADGKEVDEGSRAHIISCTIADNTADDGGGLYIEDGAAMQVNTVIWGNSAGANKNVSGVTNEKFADTRLGSVFNIGTNLYPFNDCFVESQEMPSDFENLSLESAESNSNPYFADEYRRLKDYSLLIKHGVRNEYQETSGTGFADVFNVAETDIQGIDRVQAGNGAERLDAGAFAYEGGILPTELITRLFVSQATNVTMPDGGDMMKYLGKSFYTSFSTLEDALGYIRSMREDGQNTDVKFEILVAGGTYKPTNKRETTADVVHDQRLYSFEVPAGVSIYGGFNGTEFISSKGEDDATDITTIPGVAERTFNCMGEIDGILSAREYSDFNQNKLLEPWELAEQTILSGQINVSNTKQNAYHVIYSEATDGDVLLDGVTVMYGQTYDALSNIQTENEQGRGGGIYSSGVNYTLRRCRVLDNKAVRGGGIFVRNADLNLTGCILAGNETVANAEQQGNTLTSRGGAVYIAWFDENVAQPCLSAVNTLWSNNESAGEGGAIGTNYAEGITSVGDPMINLMNNTFVKNKAKTNPVIYSNNAKSKIVNTLIWGNEGDTYDKNTNIAGIFDVRHSASDVDYGGKFTSGSDGNISLDNGNMEQKGPRFTNPATTAGVAGNSANNLWNPVAISVVTDAGDGVSHTTEVPEGEEDHVDNDITGAYKHWFNNNIPEAYIEPVGGDYSRYSGPRGKNNEDLCKTIDIGVYEYQYVLEFSKMDAIYVDTISRGTGSGENWANATDDLRGAIIGAANPTDKPDSARYVYVRDGDYHWNRLSSNSAYILDMGGTVAIPSLTLKGSCTGVEQQQNFSKQTVIRNSVNDNGRTQQLMSVSTNAKKVTIEGFTFINTNDTGNGITASTSSGGSLTLKNCAFRQNGSAGMNVSGNEGEMLIYNTLFADGGTGFAFAATVNTDNITLVNTTFANNKTADMSAGLSKVYNSASWENGKRNMPTDGDNNNKVFAKNTVNSDIHRGPNFVDPQNTNIEARDYHIRPSLTLLNQGSNAHYAREVLGEADATDENATIPDTEVDLGNNARLVDSTIDIGAYEYEAPLQPIVYVKAGVESSTGYDGKSWQTALSDLQGAADLAGIYADQNKTNGYVFVHRNVQDSETQDEDVRLTLDNTKVYGGMYDETTTHIVYGDDGTINTGNVELAVEDLLGQRAGLIENAAGSRSRLGDVTISGSGSVVDGFEVNGTADIGSGGYLSTSIINESATVEGNGVLYNSLVRGDVSGIKAVNVTATGTISTDYNNTDYNNREKATADNSYIDDNDEWKYQLMETSSGDIDAGTAENETETKTCIDAVGHDRDIAGNKRIRNTVDNGCFETWDLKEDGEITAEDYPHGKSVVYVRADKELSINSGVYNESKPFNPGVLLLEHRAGLRGGGNSVALSHVIVERSISKYGMAYVPFDVTDFEDNGVSVKYYDGEARAAYDYKFDGEEGKAWKDRTTGYGRIGLLLDNSNGTEPRVVRFVGKGDSENDAVYTESASVTKLVELTQYNFEDPWTGESTTGRRFTHKENMGWNLFGSPYLCAMNYKDMEYGRVIYGYDGENYKSVNTEGDGTTEQQGYIPAGDAVFTQTATLYATGTNDNAYETFTVAPPSKKQGSPYGGFTDLEVALTRTGETRSDDGTVDDELQLSAVMASEASTDFDLSADGVKWMADGRPQIYATRGNARYSLLSAVNIDGEVGVGITVPEAGMYTISVPDGCDANKYETVILEDATASRTVDLLEGGYDFTTATAGDIMDRFTISFNRKVGNGIGDGIRAYSVRPGIIRVEGVSEGDRITVYSADGMNVARHIATSTEEDVTANVVGVGIVKVERDGRTVAVKKVKVKN